MRTKTYEELLSEAGFSAAEAWQAVAKRMESHSQQQPLVWGEWAGGWNALAHRFLGVHGEGERLRAMLSEAGSDAPPPVERTEQEHRLFTFYAAGLSAFETFVYSMFALGALLLPDQFPFTTDEDKRAADVPNAIRSFKEHFPHEVVTAELERISRSSGFRKWQYSRNLLSHRSAPGRAIYATVGSGSSGRGDRPADWMGHPLDPHRIGEHEEWLAEELAALVTAAEEFVAKHF